MPGFTYDEITRPTQILGMISEFRGTGSSLQRFYNLGVTSTPGKSIKGRSGLYDIFNPTRSMPVARAGMTGPARVGRKPIGQKAITLPRFFEAMAIEDEYVFHNRPLGQPMSVIDPQGRTYIARQIAHEMRKFVNLAEFMAASMFRGGWGLKAFGEDLLPVDRADPDAVITFDTLVPAEHKDQIALGASGADIIDVSWDDPDADINAQFLALNKVHAARHGAPLRHVWLNGTTVAPLFNNNVLKAIGGSVYRVFDSMSGRPVNPDEKYPDTGVDIVFRGLPEVTFHVYNQVVQTGLVRQTRAALLDPTLNTLLIPDGEIFITPDPGSWCELVAGSEPMQHDITQAQKEVIGFEVGRSRAIDPPRYDLRFWSCQAPVLTEEFAVFNPTVIFE